MGGCGARPLAVPSPRGGTPRGLGRGAQAKPHTRAVYGPHIYGPHIYSAAGPKHRSEVSILQACTSKITHKRSDPKHRTSHLRASHLRASHLRASHLLRCWSQTPVGSRWSQTPVGSVASIGPHKQNHTQGEWSQTTETPYEPPDAGFGTGVWDQWSQTPVGSVASIGMHKQDHTQGDWSQTL